MKSVEDYAKLTSKEQKEEAISGASSGDELNRMWTAWSKQGWSKDGLLYARIVEKKVELGEKVSNAELKRVNATREHAKIGAKLPPITVKRNVK